MTSSLTPSDFPGFFQDLYGYPPFPWQQALVERLCSATTYDGAWPDTIDLPTGSGKTACLDAAVFALAAQAGRAPTERTMPRRIVLCVDRRVVVNDAFIRARELADRLRKDDASEVLRRVAASLRRIASAAPEDGAVPLDAFEMRGGIYRDEQWARSATQPTIITTTVDQLGSRLLFRGYGVSPGSRPMYAGLLSHDTVILLDEAHISNPFAETLQSIRRFTNDGRWASSGVGVPPLRVVTMTATPSTNSGDILRLTRADREDRVLSSRLRASKPATLHTSKKGKLERDAVDHALGLLRSEARAKRIAVILNRVASAKAVFEALWKHAPDDDFDTELMIGSMRPIDRERQVKRIRARASTASAGDAGRPFVLVATQCVEVGADYDFDALVTQAAALDALRQRFGRLNRSGRAENARAVILMEAAGAKPDAKLKDDKPEDPIYGNAMARTWNWLHAMAADGVIDFGIDAMERRLEALREEPGALNALLSPLSQKQAPVLLPAHVDALAQTHPEPAIGPDIAMLLRGEDASSAEVTVCWRADITEHNHKNWADIVSLCPPTSPECMSVPWSRFRRWWNGEQSTPRQALGDADAPAFRGDEDDDRASAQRNRGLIWSRSESEEPARAPRPGDTIVLPIDPEEPSWAVLGHVPLTGLMDIRSELDVAEEAILTTRRKAVLRLFPGRPALGPHPSGTVSTGDEAEETDPEKTAMNDLLERLKDPEDEPTADERRTLVAELADALERRSEDIESSDPRKTQGEDRAFIARKLAASHQLAAYPDKTIGFVLTSKRLPAREDARQSAQLSVDDDDEGLSKFSAQTEVTLSDHLDDVVQAVTGSLELLGIQGGLRDAFQRAAEMHDWGKADERFQAMLLGITRSEALMRRSAFDFNDHALLAKSNRAPSTRSRAGRERRRAELPAGFRHEMLSVDVADRALPADVDPATRDLILHLIATHHGRARPFAPVVPDPDPPGVIVGGVEMSQVYRAAAAPPHRLDSGIAERFWRLTRRFGWWGLAYLEALLRLADWQASQSEASKAQASASAPKQGASA